MGRSQISSSVPIIKNMHRVGDDKILGSDLEGNIFFIQVKNILDEVAIDQANNIESLESDSIDSNESIEVNEVLEPKESITNEMCDVDQGDIRNKGNKKRQNCY